MRLTEGTNINGFKVLTENDIQDNVYISPKKVDSNGYASLFSVSLSKLIEIGKGTLLINCDIKNSVLGDKNINANMSLKVRLNNGVFTSQMEVCNNSSFNLENIISARVIDGNYIIAYVLIQDSEDYIVCNYNSLCFYTDNMLYGDLNDFSKPNSKVLNGNRASGEDIPAIYKRLKHEDVFRVNVQKDLTSSATILDSDNFSSFLNGSNSLKDVIKNNGTYEVEFISSFIGDITSDSCYIVMQVNNSTVFINNFKIASTASLPHSVVTKFYRNFNKGDSITVRIVNSQAKGLSLTTNSFIKIKEM